MVEGLKRVAVAFYRTSGGQEPVREWIKSLGLEEDLQTLEFGWPIGMPLCRPIASRKGLWEVRSNLTGGRIARVLFFVSGGRLVALHGFIKKTQKTPDKDLDLAMKRMKEVGRHGQP